MLDSFNPTVLALLEGWDISEEVAKVCGTIVDSAAVGLGLSFKVFWRVESPAAAVGDLEWRHLLAEVDASDAQVRDVVQRWKTLAAEVRLSEEGDVARTRSWSQ